MHDDDPPDEAARLAFQAQLDALDGQIITVRVPSFIYSADGDPIGMDVEEYQGFFASKLHHDDEEESPDD